MNKLLREALEECDEDNAKKLVRATIINAAKGNGTALRLIWDVIEGPIQKTEHRLDLSVLTDEEFLEYERLANKIWDGGKSGA